MVKVAESSDPWLARILAGDSIEVEPRVIAHVHDDLDVVVEQ